MTILEHKIPSGVTIPDENHDWSTKIVEECIVGEWYLSKIKQRVQTASSSDGQFGLVLTKLQQLGIKEILV